MPRLVTKGDKAAFKEKEEREAKLKGDGEKLHRQPQQKLKKLVWELEKVERGWNRFGGTPS